MRELGSVPALIGAMYAPAICSCALLPSIWHEPRSKQ